jgi:hypothetical protein
MRKLYYLVEALIIKGMLKILNIGKKNEMD